jgi:hypothetical protein
VAGIGFFEPPLDAARASGLNVTATQIVASGEYKFDLAEAFLTRFLPADNQNTSYVHFFGSELMTMTDEAVIAQMVGSGEYFQDQGGTNLSWLQAVYPGLLNRPLDSTGQNYFMGLLNMGVSRTDVALQILASTEYATNLVQGYYQNYLGHAASAEGVSYWVGQLQAGQTDEQVVAGIVSSPEYFQLHGNSNSSWLTALYQDLLDRPLDPGGAAYFDNLLYSSFATQRQAVIGDILSAPGYQGDLINRYYQEYLGHSASPTDLTGYWSGQFQAGQTYEQIQAQILGSAEYFGLNGSNNLTWLQQVYVQVLKRPLDQGGLTYFGSLLGAGVSRQQVALTILQSEEYQALVVQQTYMTFLGRQASMQDVAFWQSQFGSGMTTATFIGDVVQSLEYFNRTHPYP